MINFVRDEIIAMFQFLRRNSTETIVILSSTLCLVLDRYYTIVPTWFSSFVYYGVIPILVIVLILRKNPLKFGLQWGSPEIWGKYVLIICLISGLVLFAASFMPSLQKYYLMDNFNFLGYSVTSAVSLSASEFMYRGFLIFGLRDKLKEGSILVQTIPFVLMHLGKPALETISTLFTGVLFGWVAYRGNSFWPAFFIHLFINVFFVGLINWLY
jgi:membrane protease YdiL (CAAX protease family)